MRLTVKCFIQDSCLQLVSPAGVSVTTDNTYEDTLATTVINKVGEDTSGIVVTGSDWSAQIVMENAVGQSYARTRYQAGGRGGGEGEEEERKHSGERQEKKGDFNNSETLTRQKRNVSSLSDYHCITQPALVKIMDLESCSDSSSTSSSSRCSVIL